MSAWTVLERLAMGCPASEPKGGLASDGSLLFFHKFRDENHGQRGNDGGADQALG